MPKGENRKYCNRCKATKSIEEFSKDAKGKNGLQSWCKKCAATRNKIYYQKHAKKMRRQSGSAYKKRIARNKKWLRGYLDEHPCIDCSTQDVRVLEFDHVRGVKDRDISRLVNDGYAIKRIEEEIAKCDVVCANCHRIRTFARSGGNYKTV